MGIVNLLQLSIPLRCGLPLGLFPFISPTKTFLVVFPLFISSSLPFQLSHLLFTRSKTPSWFNLPLMSTFLYPIYSHLRSSSSHSFVWPVPLIAAALSGSTSHTCTSALASLWHSLLSTWYSSSIPSQNNIIRSSNHSRCIPYPGLWFLLHTSITTNHHSQVLHCVHLLNDLISNFNLTLLAVPTPITLVLLQFTFSSTCSVCHYGTVHRKHYVTQKLVTVIGVTVSERGNC